MREHGQALPFPFGESHGGGRERCRIRAPRPRPPDHAVDDDLVLRDALQRIGQRGDAS
jgi:hypothetical protein